MKKFFLTLTLVALFLTGCGSPSTGGDSTLRVLASTSFLADITQNIAGDRVHVDSLLPFGADPHAYQAAPSDVAKIAECDLLILNGLGYESFIETFLDAKNAKSERMTVEASAGLSPRKDAGIDPHMWLDPNLVVTYVENIRNGLIQVDPAGAEIYKVNAEAYTAKLKELDAWIVEQVNTIPAGRRMLVTNHEAVGYFAERYGFEVVGSVVPSFSSNAAPSAREIVALMDKIKGLNAPAIFLDMADNNALASQIADETGVRVVDDLHLESLTDGAPAGTYIDMMKYNVLRIVEVLK